LKTRRKAYKNKRVLYENLEKDKEFKEKEADKRT